MGETKNKKQGAWGKKWRIFKRQKCMQLFVLIGMVYLAIFKFLPMTGILMAFKEFSLSDGFFSIFTSSWIGFSNFKEFFSEINFANIMLNTFGISILKLLFTFPLPILFAVMITELSNGFFKKFVQTISYLPHFISWVVVSGLVAVFLSTQGGVANEWLLSLGWIKKGIPFLTDPVYFWPIAIVTDAWKEFGWWSILFIAAITGIDPTLYEAADMDGASRLQKIQHITLPGIYGTIAVVLILSIGNLMGGGLSGSNFEQSYLMGNALNLTRSDIIQTYVLRTGLAQARYSYATAVGLLQSVISVILIFTSNYFVKKGSGTGLF